MYIIRKLSGGYRSYFDVDTDWLLLSPSTYRGRIAGLEVYSLSPAGPSAFSAAPFHRAGRSHGGVHLEQLPRVFRKVASGFAVGAIWQGPSKPDHLHFG